MEQPLRHVDAPQTLHVSVGSFHVCAWDGCDATYKPNAEYLPKGWTTLLAFWPARPVAKVLEVPARDWLRDAVLCPKHTAAFDGLLKPLAREINREPKGTRNMAEKMSPTRSLRAPTYSGSAGVPAQVIADHFLTFGMGLFMTVTRAMATATRLEDLAKSVRDQAAASVRPN